jgi:type IV secretory pathway VirB2 component (pilin)
MPCGGRRTHDFPHGRPFFLTFIEIAFSISFIISAVSFGFENWHSAAPTLALFVAYVVTYSLAVRRYERTGQAVRRRTVNVMVRFPEGFPAPLLAVRVAFLVVVGLMLMFGVGPFRFEVAKNGIIGCVFALVAVAVANVLLERHYMRIGHATEVEFSTKLGK